jgi:hypothetical protein
MNQPSMGGRMIEAERRLRAMKSIDPNMSMAEERVLLIGLTRDTIREANERTAKARRDQWFVLVGGIAIGAWFSSLFPDAGEGVSRGIFGVICLTTALGFGYRRGVES